MLATSPDEPRRTQRIVCHREERSACPRGAQATKGRRICFTRSRSFALLRMTHSGQGALAERGTIRGISSIRQIRNPFDLVLERAAQGRRMSCTLVAVPTESVVESTVPP